MAIFLEDAAVKKETFSLNNLTESVECSCHELNESIAYSEAAWQNILISSMKEEYKVLSEAATEEDKKTGVGEAIKNFFRKVIEWVKKMFLKVKDFAQKVLQKVSALFGNVAAFAKEHEKEIREGGAKCDTEIEISNWKADPLPMIDVIGESFRKDFKTLEEVDAEMKKFIEDDTTTKKVKVSSCYTRALEGALKAQGATKDIVKNIKSIEEPLKETDKAANDGLNSKTEEKAQEAKEKVETGKSKVTSKSKLASACVKLVTRCMKDAHKINVAAYKACKSGKKEAKKADKEAAKAAKK